MNPVCEISNGGVTTFRFLCPRHQSDRRGSGWSVKPNGRDAAWPCDDCITADQAAPGYVTPTVDFVPTSPDARLPTRKEYQRPKPPETWAARLARLRQQQEAA